MTEWTLDLMVPSEPDDVGSVGMVETPTEDDPYADLVANALIDDIELDRVDWFA